MTARRDARRDMRVAIVGAGVMAEAMIAGLLADKAVAPIPAGRLASAPRPTRPARRAARDHRGDPQRARRSPGADIVVLAVKPQMLRSVMREVGPALAKGQVVLSIVAGATLRTLTTGLDHAAVVRAMPNTPSQIRRGITVWTASSACTARQRELAPIGPARHRLREGGRRRDVRGHGHRPVGNGADLPVRGDGGAHRRRRAHGLPARAGARPGGRDADRLRRVRRRSRSCTPPSCGTPSPRRAAPAPRRSTSWRRGAFALSCRTRCGPRTAAPWSSASASRRRRQLARTGRRVQVVRSGRCSPSSWPEASARGSGRSRAAGSPKQLLALTGDTSLLQQTVARLGPLLKPHDIYVITSQAHVRATQEQLPQLPADNVFGEPLARSTAVAAGAGDRAWRAASPTRSPWCCRPTTTSPTRRRSPRRMREAVTRRRARLPGHAGRGAVPRRHRLRLHQGRRAACTRRSTTALVERFVEKPDADDAAKFLDEGGYLWNAGIFVWRVYAFRQALERFQPELAAALDRGGGAAPDPGLDERGARPAGADPGHPDRRRHRRAGGRRGPGGGGAAGGGLERHRLMVGPAGGPLAARAATAWSPRASTWTAARSASWCTAATGWWSPWAWRT